MDAGLPLLLIAALPLLGGPTARQEGTGPTRIPADVPRLVAGDAPGERPDRVAVDMLDGWHRRDWDKCRGASTVSHLGDTIVIHSDRSAVNLWQSPTILGIALDVDPDQKWLRNCDRPPLSFAPSRVRDADVHPRLLAVQEYRYLSWRWRIDTPIDDRLTVDDRLRIRREGDDFAAKLGVIMVPEGSTSHREIAYVWMKSKPVDTLMVQEWGPFFWRFRFYRMVAETGTAHAGTWRSAERDLVADYLRIWPDEKPGKVVSVYLMTDGDNTGSVVTGEFADLEFRRER